MRLEAGGADGCGAVTKISPDRVGAVKGRLDRHFWWPQQLQVWGRFHIAERFPVDLREAVKGCGSDIRSLSLKDHSWAPSQATRRAKAIGVTTVVEKGLLG